MQQVEQSSHFELKAQSLPSSDETLHGQPPEAYGLGAIRYDSEGFATHLEVGLAGETLTLPRLDVPPQNPIDTIFYLDISRENDPDLFDAAANWFATQLLTYNVNVLVTPPSHKSVECIEEAVRRASRHRVEPIQLITLVKGEAADSTADLVEWYTPITAPVDGKTLSIRWDDRVFLSRLTPEERAGLWIADDVLSTGATLNAIKRVLHQIAGDTQPIRTMVIAKEAPINDSFPPLVDSDVVAGMIIGEIPGGLPRKEEAA